MINPMNVTKPPWKTNLKISLLFICYRWKNGDFKMDDTDLLDFGRILGSNDIFSFQNVSQKVSASMLLLSKGLDTFKEPIPKKL